MSVSVGMAAQDRSAAVQIVRPPVFVPAKELPAPGKRRGSSPGIVEIITTKGSVAGGDATQRLCRNVLIYG